MATDYDAPRRNEADELGEDSLEELKARRAEAQSASVDVDETDFNENLELPGADLSGEELTVRVLPKQEDEFTCSRCFLVQHRSRLAVDPRRPAVLPRLRGLRAGPAARHGSDRTGRGPMTEERLPATGRGAAGRPAAAAGARRR